MNLCCWPQICSNSGKCSVCKVGNFHSAGLSLSLCFPSILWDGHTCVLGNLSKCSCAIKAWSSSCTVCSADLATRPTSMKTLLLAALFGCLGTNSDTDWLNIYSVWCPKHDCSPEFTVAAFAVPADKVRWCLKSDQEYQKCKRLSAVAPAIACVPKQSTLDCIVAIKVRNTVN